VTGTAKKTRRSKSRARNSGPGAFNTVLAVLTVFVLLLGSLGVMNQRDEHFTKAKEIPMRNEIIASVLSRDLNSELFFLATEALSKTKGVNLAATNIIFKSSVNELLEQRYDPRRFGDNRVTPLGSDLSITIMPMSVETSSCSGNLSLAGDLAPQTVPAYYRLQGSVYLDMNSSSEHLTIFNITIDKLLPDITPYIATKLTEFEANGQSEFTDLGRMVRYMLTTLVRFRASEGIGSGPYDTEKDLLNEGDVELAVNLAVLLEEARLFGTYDQAAVKALDHYFFYATDPAQHLGEVSWEPNNPTGIRSWGSAERKNYARYENHMSAGVQSTMENILLNLVGTYISRQTIDPADLLALYLNLENYEYGWSIDPFDENTILNEKFLFDGRYSPDRRDESHLVYLTQMAPPELMLKDPTMTFTMDYREHLAVDQSPDYLVVGSDLLVTKDITVPWKWMTNARLSEGSRTGGVPPPQPPPDHDWVMMWDFSIFGNFSLAVGRTPETSRSDGTEQDWLVNRTLSLDIPINIFTFLKYRPTNSAVVFTNLNVGSPAGATFNFTLESLAYEHFANSTWSEIKDLYGAALGETIRLVKSSTCPYPAALASGSEITRSLGAQQLQGISPEVWASIDDFVINRLTSSEVSTQILRPLLNSEYFMRLGYIKGDGTSDFKYTLRLSIDTNVGPIVIDLRIGEGNDGITGRANMTSKIIINKLLDVDYSFKWDASYQNLRPQGSGTLGGDWSVMMEVQGQTTLKGLDIPLGRDGLLLRAFQYRSNNEPDLTPEMASALPSTLTGETADQIVQVAKALRSVHVPAMALLVGYNPPGYGDLYGLKANTPADVDRMLGWFVNNSVQVATFGILGRLDLSTIGSMASQDLSRYSGIKATFMNPYMFMDIPLMYYGQAMQLYTVHRDYLPLHQTLILASLVEATVPGTDRTFLTLEYSIFSETFLSDPEVNYG
jgi:hypothetical protein